MLAEQTIRAMNSYSEFYERAASVSGRTRERMVALGEADELFFRLYPHHYRALQTVRVASQLHATAAPRQEPWRRCESRAVALLSRVIRDALTEGDLELSSARRPEDLAFSIWALAFGTRALMNTAVATQQLGIEDGYAIARDSVSLLFDALGWRPLACEWDYEKTRARVRDDLFREHANPAATPAGQTRAAESRPRIAAMTDDSDDSRT
jgi:hypothetical protein